ncbi:MAG: VanZ family protein [Lachnospiraceae bacterium]|jgi:hypothetical protein|nr:VanZ family protein [Lachnospiraceae bacterium]MEE3460594.1 VanZ family protein [Lachnospiraceae bacterium]
MKKKTVSISSVTVVISLLFVLLSICLYYFVDEHAVFVIFSAVFSILITAFSLLESGSYRYVPISSSITAAGLSIFGVILFNADNKYISFDMSIVAAVCIMILVPFILCVVWDTFDRRIRFEGFNFFFHVMTIIIGVFWLMVIFKQYFADPLPLPYTFKPDTLSSELIPFMTTYNYIEAARSADISLMPEVRYLAELALMGAPAGFLIAVYFKNMRWSLRFIMLIIVPALLETLQVLTGTGASTMDDICVFLIGELTGAVIFHIMNGFYIHSLGYALLEKDDSGDTIEIPFDVDDLK